MEFQISTKAKKTIFGVIGVGLLAFIIGIVQHSADASFGTRLMSNFLIDGFFFFAIALGALFFLALQYATETGWSVAVKRVVEGVASYVLVGIGILVAIFLVLTFTDGGFFGQETLNNSSGHIVNTGHIYQWMDPAYTDIESHSYDPIIANKAPFLTKHSAKSAHNISRYTSEKIKLELNYEFQSIEKVIQETSIDFKN